MVGLGRLVNEMARQRRGIEAAMSAAGLAGAPAAEADSRVREVRDFGSNPGNLRMFVHAPAELPPAPALVVVLHGCTQTAAGYEVGAGWSTLADRYGFVLLMPEQQAANNPKTCFSWFLPGDTSRDSGEVLSIRQMVERACRAHDVDRSRVFVTGLSAGGAMAGALLAAYPEVFAGGAIVAGLPYGAASSVPEAFESMLKGQSRPAREWGDLVRAASPHRGPWPRVSVWHGAADSTVTPLNAREIVKQWTDVHGLPLTPTREEVVDGQKRRVWIDAEGREAIEDYSIAGMAHGTPLGLGGEEPLGRAGPFMLDVGIASSYHIARFWGLTGAPRSVPPRRPATTAGPAAEPFRRPTSGAIHDIISRALRAAGLTKG
ncbi:PHB depolymerase family esterase [Alsobacter sp. SYSU M60028]|uniref:PHB depolymerase family esterase n=1 Tax=Alsobacter ponti TaxID=2962936 RepID=A0ABT1LAP3_9HYPH|nr:PHB depolymerase family esterase [Alsobacter ponti]MCP8938542.1 PHB depolymerase family esterase [Alsobacter ponti]